uniref:M-phase inducer phosphatase 3 isoform X1 n=1 Tax=Podarcis muralis TaxID=64176 RepID=UPI00109F5EF0|nr:M-phase inducer phosphatase 3 isoform X1 [Podarcis muralis]XP_028574378.1 M-phase inducer phosphatase 3 isoform X1 [Podarcis muralis]
MSENFPPIEADASHLCLGFRSRCRMIMFQDAEFSLPFTPEAPLTPISSLTQGFRTFSTLTGDTPRRCLDLSNLSNGEEETAFNFSQSPGQKGSMGLQNKLRLSGRQCSQLLQSRVLCSTPDTPSCFRHISRVISSPSMNKENEGSPFKHPGWRLPKSLLFWKKPPDAQQSYSTMLEAGDLEEYEMKDLGSPISAGTPPEMPESLGGFPELCPEQEETEKPFSGHLSSMAILLSGPLLTQDISVSEVSMNKTRVFRSPSLPEKLNRPVLKKAAKSQDEDEAPIKVKQKHSPTQEEPDGVMHLKKAASLSDMEIVRALDQDHSFRQLIGDFSCVYSLPTVAGRHQDLKYITSETMAALLQGQFQSLIEKFCIIDCRYPYEYDGGHIKGALNIPREDDLFESFLRKPLLSSTPKKRLILVFHCEYSSERGPKMCRYLREEDRAMNEYPALHYPELYVLQGGYKDFFVEYKELCEPQSYCPMRHQDFKAEMLKFRTRSKTWAGERRWRGQVARLMKP